MECITYAFSHFSHFLGFQTQKRPTVTFLNNNIVTSSMDASFSAMCALVNCDHTTAQRAWSLWLRARPAFCTDDLAEVRSAMGSLPSPFETEPTQPLLLHACALYIASNKSMQGPTAAQSSTPSWLSVSGFLQSLGIELVVIIIVTIHSLS